MNLGLTITGIIMFAICSLPFVLPYMSRKKQEKQFLQTLFNSAEKQNCKITQHEFCGDFIIGLDDTANALFFYKKKNEEETKIHIHLSDIQNCKMITTCRSNENNNLKFTDKVELSLMPITKNKPNILLEFYNTQDSFQAGPDLLLVGKWERIINELLKYRKTTSLETSLKL